MKLMSCLHRQFFERTDELSAFGKFTLRLAGQIGMGSGGHTVLTLCILRAAQRLCSAVQLALVSRVGQALRSLVTGLVRVSLSENGVPAWESYGKTCTVSLLSDLIRYLPNQAAAILQQPGSSSTPVSGAGYRSLYHISWHSAGQTAKSHRLKGLRRQGRQHPVRQATAGTLTAVTLHAAADGMA